MANGLLILEVVGAQTTSTPPLSLWWLHISGLKNSDERGRINLDLGQDVCQHGIRRDPGDAVDVIVD